MYKLICTDVDGTLVDKNGTLLDSDREALQRAINSGIHVAVVSGRFRPGVDKIAKQLNLPVWYTCFNGLYIEAGRDNVIYSNTTSKDAMLKILDYLKDSEYTIHIFGLDDLYAEKDDYFYQLFRNVISDKGSHLTDLKAVLESDTKIYKMIIKNKDENKIKNLKYELEKLNIANTQYVFSGPFILEVLPQNANKARAIDSYCNYMQIDRSQVMAFGDYDNDMDMIKTAGTGIAMGNATEQCKAIADFVTKPVTEGGISYAIGKMIFNT